MVISQTCKHITFILKETWVSQLESIGNLFLDNRCPKSSKVHIGELSVGDMDGVI